MNFFRTIVLLFLSFYLADAQDQVVLKCGTTHLDLEEIKGEMLQNRAFFKGVIHSRSAVSYIPVKIHNVALDDGTGSTSIVSLLRMMCTVNNAFAAHNIQFYIKDLYTLNSTTIATNPRSQNGSLQMQLFKDSKALNLYIAHKVNEDGVVGYYIGPPGSTTDYIVLDKNFVNHSLVAAHEIGHYLSLPHTFHGWEGSPWDKEKHGTIVTKTFAPDGVTFVELADSSNCGVRNVGDGFCDTPADYNFGLGASGCEFNTEVKDANGKTLKPQTNNFMNYFFNCGSYIFTPNQATAVLNSYNSSGRKDIRGTNPPNSTVISSPAKLITPVGGAKTLTQDSVTLDWDPVPGATQYLVQYDRLPSFEFRVITTITKDTKLTIRNLVKDGTYHWRIIPFNEYSTCYVDPGRSSFVAGGSTSTPDIPEVKSFLAAPNPLIGNKQLQLSLESSVGFTAVISVYNIQGKKSFYQSKERIPSGTFTKIMDLNHFSPGVYFVSITTEKGIATRKIVVY